MMSEGKKKICVVVSAPMTAVVFLRDQLRALSEIYELWVVANAPDGAFLKEVGVDARFYPIPIQRKISPKADLLALGKLLRFFWREKFELVHSVTPKAGLLAMLAAFGARVPWRVHTFTGQVWANKRGAAREFLRWMDAGIAFFASRVLVDSKSQREFLVANGVVSEKKSQVLGSGSISGVDARRFVFDPVVRERVRKEYGIGEGEFVFLYVGRLNRDKGIPELVEAFGRVAEEIPCVKLLVVGPDEEGMEARMKESLYREKVVRVGYTKKPEDFMVAGDAFVLPSHREGFGSTVIEAAAVGLPAIATRIYGLTDAVEDGVTGVLVGVNDPVGLAGAMAGFAGDREGAKAMGQRAKQRALDEFSVDRVTGLTVDFYRRLVGGGEG